MMNLSTFLETYRYNPQHDLINEGGFGKIYRAWGEHDREVAIKVCQVQNNKYTLKREFELASKLAKHPNIAFYESVYEFEIPGVGLMEYAVMQYYPDGDLRKVLQEHQLSLEEKSDILKGILQGVDFLHTSGIIHRDLKPGNILMQKVQGKWRPKITDFGLGKSFVGGGEVSNTSAGIVSLLYASPEQILGKATYTNTDLWPVGIITYLLFTGKVPFESDFPKETESYRADLTKKIVAGKVPDDVDSLPEPFRSVCKQCFEVDNTKRVQSAADLLKTVNESVGLLCSQCGAKLSKGAMFCTTCGKSVVPLTQAAEKKMEFVEEKTLVDQPNNIVAPPIQKPAATPIKPAPVTPPVVHPVQPAAKAIQTPIAPKKKKMSVFGWLIIFVLASVLIFLTVLVLPNMTESKTKSNSTSTSNSSSDSEYEDPFEGLSNSEINDKGMTYYGRGDYDKAKEYFQEASRNGYTEAKRNLGIYYMEVEGDYEQAFSKLTAAADEGDADAMYNLGLMYERGYVDGYSNMEMANYWHEMYGYYVGE